MPFESDWLLIYLIVGEEITFVRTGTHSDLFDESLSRGTHGPAPFLAAGPKLRAIDSTSTP
jgi:hypothetical protein